MSGSHVEQARYKSMLDSLCTQDPQIAAIVAYSKFVVVYLLQQEGATPGWRKANIEGPVYVVRRRSAPWYQLIVKNQFSATDLQDNLHPNWELDCQKNYAFYKVEDTTKRIRGLWFHDDKERQKLEGELSKLLDEIRKGQSEMPTRGGFGGMDAVADRQEPARHEPPARAAEHIYSQQPQPKAPYNPQQPPRGGGAQSAQVTQGSLSSSFHSLADDDSFLNIVMQKLAEGQQQVR